MKITKVELSKSGHITTKKGNLVTNKKFIKLQEKAHYLVTMANVAKGKEFGVNPTSYTVQDLIKEVDTLLNTQKLTTFVELPSEPKQDINESLKKEALNWIKYAEENLSAKKVNKYMQQFNILVDYETHGLVFQKGISKLNKIYSVKEITEAVKVVIDFI